jgi:hypothetical protein
MAFLGSLCLIALFLQDGLGLTALNAGLSTLLEALGQHACPTLKACRLAAGQPAARRDHIGHPYPTSGAVLGMCSNFRAYGIDKSARAQRPCRLTGMPHASGGSTPEPADMSAAGDTCTRQPPIAIVGARARCWALGGHQGRDLA